MSERNAVTPLNLAAYFQGRQPFWQAAIFTSVGSALTSVFFVSGTLKILGVAKAVRYKWGPEEEASWRNLLLLLIEGWGIVLLVVLGLSMWILWSCSRNIKSGPVAMFTRLILAGFSLIWAWLLTTIGRYYVLV